MNWSLIHTHWYDIIQVLLLIKAGEGYYEQLPKISEAVIYAAMTWLVHLQVDLGGVGE